MHEAFSELPDSWAVLWDVPVGLFGRPSARLRQIDFLLINERVGIVLVEVKGGEIRVDGGEWSTLPAGQTSWKRLDRSPFVQVADQRYQLQRYLSRRLNLDGRSFAHAVALPGCRVDRDLGPDAPRQLTLDIEDLTAPGATLRRVRDHWGASPGISQADIDAVISILKPTFTMTVLAVSQAADTTRHLDRETRRQAEMVETQVEGYRQLLHVDRAVVLGGAGTGKTVIAVERAKQLARTGLRTLLVCHRAAVRAFIITLLGVKQEERGYNPLAPGQMHIASWSELLRVASGGTTVAIHVEPQHVADRLMKMRDSMPEPYDALVVDEGQEFTAGHLEALAWLVDDPDASPMYLFADPFQQSGLLRYSPHRRGKFAYRWAPPLEAPTVFLRTNCRNSRPIADFASNFYPEAAPSAVVDGPMPTVITAPNEKKLVRSTLLKARSLRDDDGFRPHQILIVLIGVQMKDALSRASSCGVHLIDANDVYRFPLAPKDVRIVVGTADSVQGLESDVCVVAYRAAHQGRSALRDLYIATSRARSYLVVVTDATEDQIRGANRASRRRAQAERLTEVLTTSDDPDRFAPPAERDERQ